MIVAEALHVARAPPALCPHKLRSPITTRSRLDTFHLIYTPADIEEVLYFVQIDRLA